MYNGPISFLAIVKSYPTAATNCCNGPTPPLALYCVRSQRASKVVTYLLYNCLLIKKANFEKRLKLHVFD